jgi:isopenicillin-N epimerase
MIHPALREQFLLDSETTFLNFGSFGATPRPVMDEYHRQQLLCEKNPVQYIAVNSIASLARSRKLLGDFLNCEADDLVYVSNPSYAVNIVSHSLALKEGDEILSTNIEYGACDRAWKFIGRKTGANYIRQPIRLPLTTKEQFVEDFFRGFTETTKVVFISQITSATALVLPVKEICEEAKRRGAITFVDGAHVPGHIPLDLSALQADFYTGACHKWMMAPKGCSFLYAKREMQDLLDPLVVSWGYESAAPSPSRFIDYHQMQGTRDLSAFLCVEACLSFMKENNWTQVAASCRELVRNNAERFCRLAGTQPLCPVTEEFLGQMFSVPLNCSEPEKLQRLLYEQYRIEIPVMRQDERVLIRYSINAFNSQSDLDKLYAALSEIIATTNLIRVN